MRDGVKPPEAAPLSRKTLFCEQGQRVVKRLFALNGFRTLPSIGVAPGL